MSSRIHRLEHDLKRRPPKRRRPLAAPAPTPQAASLSTDAGGPITLVCDVDHRQPRPTISGARSFNVNAFEAIDDTPETRIAVNADVSLPPSSVPPSPVPPSPTVAPPGSPLSTPPTSGEDLGGWTLANDGSSPGVGASESTVFAQDIAAILAHTQGDTPQPAAMSMPIPTSTSSPSHTADTTPSPGVGAVSGHDIFDRMASANRYDQGPVALSVDFSAMDRAIDRGVPTVQPPTTAPSTPPSMPPVAPPEPTVAPASTDTTPLPPPPSSPTDTVADVAAIETITSTGGPFRVTTDVPLVPQAPGLSCHAAACASIVAWRDNVKPSAADVAAAAGYWERFAEARTVTYPDVLDAFGMAHSVVGQAPAAGAWRELIERGGPLWVAASPPGEHAVVVSGVTGDGTVSGTIVDVVDPWARGMTTFGAPNPGSQYHLSLAEFLMGLAADAGPVVIAQLKEGRPR